MPHSEVPVLTPLARESHCVGRVVRDLQFEVPVGPGKEDGIMEDPKIVDALEATFSVSIADEEAKSVRTVSDLGRLISTSLTPAAARANPSRRRD